MRKQTVAGVCLLLIGAAVGVLGLLGSFREQRVTGGEPGGERVGHRGRATLGATVPNEVLTDRMTAVDVLKVAQDELDALGRQFPLPPHTLALVDRFGSAGNTVIAAKPVKFTVVLWTVYYSEAQLRKVVAHEAGHMLLAEAGVKQSEELADQVALCFGSRQAREYAAEFGRVREADCAALGRMLRGDGE